MHSRTGRNLPITNRYVCQKYNLMFYSEITILATRVFLPFYFDFYSTSASHLASAVIMGFLCQLSERLLRVDVHGRTNAASAGSARAVWRSMITVLAKWAPLCFYIYTGMYSIRAMQEQLPRGAAGVAAFYKTRRVFCLSGQLQSSCSILNPAKLV
jgi:hypothetical protein